MKIAKNMERVKRAVAFGAARFAAFSLRGKFESLMSGGVAFFQSWFSRLKIAKIWSG